MTLSQSQVAAVLDPRYGAIIGLLSKNSELVAHLQETVDAFQESPVDEVGEGILPKLVRPLVQVLHRHSSVDLENLRQRITASLERNWAVRGGISAILVEHGLQKPEQRFLVAFMLSHRSHELGWLGFAKKLSLHSYDVLSELIIVAEESSEPVDDLLALELLTLLHSLEIVALTDEYFSICDAVGIPLGQRLMEVLYAPGAPRTKVLSSFYRAVSKDVQIQISQSGDSTGLAPDAKNALLVIRSSLTPLPHSPSPGDSELPNAFGPALTVARRIRVVHYNLWLRRWNEAERSIHHIREQLERSGENARLSLRMELDLFSARIHTHRGEFAAAHALLEEASQYFEQVGNRFAWTKALRYRSELAYRRRDVRSAIELAVDARVEAGANGLEHDRAMATLMLGRLYSVLCFSGRALAFVDEALRHFKSYQGFATTLDGLFWLAAAYARSFGRVDIEPDRIERGFAILQVRRKLVERADELASKYGEHNEYGVFVKAIHGACEQTTKKPDLAEALFLLCAGVAPPERLVAKVAASAVKELAKGGTEGLGSLAILRAIENQGLSGIPGDAHAACNDAWDDVALMRRSSPENQLRHLLLLLLDPNRKAPVAKPICEFYDVIKRSEFYGGAIPHIVDVSQYFVCREWFLRDLLRVTDEANADDRHPDKDARGQLRAFRADITRYLRLELCAYVGYPVFSRVETAPEVVLDLERSYNANSVGDARIGVVHSDRLGVGWVSEVGEIESTVRIAWLRHRSEESLPRCTDDFECYVVPTEALRHGAGAEQFSPIVVGERIEGREHTLLANRIPELAQDRLFGTEEGIDPNCADLTPVLDQWQHVCRQFVGLAETPTGVTRLGEWSTYYEEWCDQYFRSRLPAQLYWDFFDLEPGPDAGSVGLEDTMTREGRPLSLQVREFVAAVATD